MSGTQGLAHWLDQEKVVQHSLHSESALLDNTDDRTKLLEDNIYRNIDVLKLTCKICGLELQHHSEDFNLFAIVRREDPWLPSAEEVERKIRNYQAREAFQKRAARAFQAEDRCPICLEARSGP